MRPHRQQPTRLPCPWDSPSKNTGVGCHFLLQCRKVKSESEVAQSCPTLSDPMDCSLPGSSAHGIFQARVVEWVAIAFTLFLYIVHLRLSYLSLLFFETLNSNGYIFPFLLCLSLLFSTIYKAPSDDHFAFLHFFFLGMVLITASCTILGTCVHSFSGTLSDLIP